MASGCIKCHLCCLESLKSHFQQRRSNMSQILNEEWQPLMKGQRDWSKAHCFALFFTFSGRFCQRLGLHWIFQFSACQKPKKKKTLEAPLGSKIGKQIQGKEERQRVPYVGEKHVLINTVFLLFQLRSHTLNEDRQQGRRLDRGGERGEVGGNSLKNWA